MTRRAVLVTRGAAAAILTTAAALATAGPATADLATAGPAVAVPGYPGAHGRCVDSVGVLGPAACDKITKVLLGDERSSTDEIAVAVVPTTGDATIEAWSTGLFNDWGVGKADENNGVLLVVAVDDHRVRLETGRGLATRLPDTATRRIVDTVITPRFAEDAYATGILNGLDEVRRTLGHRVGTSPLAALDPQDRDTPSVAAGSLDAGSGDASSGDPQSVAAGGGLSNAEAQRLFDESDDGGSGGAAGWIVVGFIGLIMIGLIAASIGSSGSPNRRRSSGTALRHRSDSHHGWMGSSFGGGSSGGDSGSSFGGGSSDGGGSSGSW